MIPRVALTSWRKHQAPWAGDDQVEQDLVLSRVLVELYSDPQIAEGLAFRGGTALNKLFLPEMSRYSEDIDLVQVRAEPIGPLMTKVRALLVPWLGRPKYKQTEGRVTFYFGYVSEPPVEKPMKVKVEINTREHFSLYGYESRPLQIESVWFSGKSEILTFSLEELLGTKLRALYQRRKGRDLFDSWICKTALPVEPAKVVSSFLSYMEQGGYRISRAEFEENFLKKLADAAFREDIKPLLRPGVSYNVDEAGRYMLTEILSLLPGEPWKHLEEQ